MAIRSLFDVPAPAKLNLFLHLRGRRADGYHLLDSLMGADRLVRHAALRAAGRRRPGAFAISAPRCRRTTSRCEAARALQGASGTSLGVDIAIDKRVPWSAGLGGGSSDAASTLLALNRLWALELAARAAAADRPVARGPTCRSSRRHPGARRRRRRGAGAGRRGSRRCSRSSSRPPGSTPGASSAAGRWRKWWRLLESRAFPKGKHPGRILPTASGATIFRAAATESLSRCRTRDGRAPGHVRQQPHDGVGERGVRMGGARRGAFGSDAERLAFGLVEPDVPLPGAPSARRLGPARVSASRQREPPAELKVCSESCRPV